MSKAKYNSVEERKAALSKKARAQMLAQWGAQRAKSGEPIGYFGRHRRVRMARGRAADQLCVGCGCQARDWAQIHGTTGENVADYRPMCKRCHFAYDDVAKRSKAATTHESRSAAAKLAWQRRSPEKKAEIIAKMRGYYDAALDS